MADLVARFCGTVRLMNSATMLDEAEKERCSKMAGAIEHIMHRDSFVNGVCEFEETLAANNWFSSYAGGILSASLDSDVQRSWEKLWDLLCVERQSLAHHDLKKGLRSYLMALVENMPIAEPAASSTGVPPLRNMPEWHLDIDDVLYQRYDTQVGFILANVRAELKKLKNPMKISAFDAISSIAINVNTNGMYQFHIKKELYKIPLGIDLKANLYFNQAYGDTVGVILKSQLVHDIDLKNEVVNILRVSSSLRIPSQVCDLLYTLIIDVSMCSVLKLCITNAGLSSSQLDPGAVPLRTKLNVLGKKK